MGDDRADIEAGFEQSGQSIPGIEQSSAGNAVDADAFKDDLVGEIAIDGPGWNAEEGHAPAVFDGTKGMMQRGGMAGHFQRRIDTFSSGNIQNGCGNGLPARRSVR